MVKKLWTMFVELSTGWKLFLLCAAYEITLFAVMLTLSVK